MNFLDFLQENSYPGRGILLGRSVDGRRGIFAYFLMGRSALSRNRVLKPTDDGIRTEEVERDALSDPSLLIYHPIRILDSGLLLANGSHLEKVQARMDSGAGFQDAVSDLMYEPDGPNWTPRITGYMNASTYALAIAKTAGGREGRCADYCFTYHDPEPGTAHFLSTYRGDGSPLPSFEGEPLSVDVSQMEPRGLAQILWEALDSQNRVSLCAGTYDPATATLHAQILNAYGPESDFSIRRQGERT